MASKRKPHLGFETTSPTPWKQVAAALEQTKEAVEYVGETSAAPPINFHTDSA